MLINNKEKSQSSHLSSPLLDSESIDWREKALRYKAEMENYRKRQQRYAADEIRRNKEDLLLQYIEVIDDLERVLLHLDVHDTEQQGIKLAYENMQKILERHGIRKINEAGTVFDPTWHEAVGVDTNSDINQGPLYIKKVIRGGYKIEDRLLRPSRVVVGN
jgi:molecular chaperone GrpE (heat shock protein)